MPGLVGLALSASAAGAFIGAQTLTNTLVILQFYDKTLLATALAMTENFDAVGDSAASIMFASLLNDTAHAVYVWPIGAVGCVSAGLMMIVAASLNKRKHKL